MDITVVSSLSVRKRAGVLVIPFWKGKQHPEAAADIKNITALLTHPLASGDFLGKEGESMVHYVADQPEARFLLLGLGAKDGLTTEKLRKIYSNVTKLCLKKKITDVNIVLPMSASLANEDVIRGVVEGIVLPNYLFTTLKHDTLKANPPTVIKHVALVGGNKAALAIANKCVVLSDAVNMVRDLVNGNADDITPQHLAAVARGLEKTSKHIQTTVFDKKRIEKEKLGLLLTVNRGSAHDPAFIIAEYKGNPKSKDLTVLIGKGITFDTGGLNLKPTGGMEEMKADMAGAATVLGVLHAAAALDLKVNVTAVIAATENGIDAKSYKPGDVYVSHSGKTVEICNTDAEGRLVLADAISYANEKLKPSRIIDLATLTGAVEVALGQDLSGLFSNDDALADLLLRFGRETGELVWRLPLHEDYRDTLKSDVADIKSTGGRPGGAIKAALFLQDFVGKVPWVHLDIAGTAYTSEARRYFPKHATGIGVRLLVSFLEAL